LIHRESRNQLAQALRHYVSGRITNDELFDVGMDIDWRDRGANAVYQMAWNYYDDNHLHYATGKHQISGTHRKDFARWIAFLYSDEEYLWPEYSFIQFINWPMNLITFGWWGPMKKRKWEQFLEAGDFSVWPFAAKQALEKVRRDPHMLRGKRAV
jgi:hypothetical protein